MKILYFSILKEKLGKQDENIEDQMSIEELKDFLKQKYPTVKELVDISKVAVNGEYKEESFFISKDDTVAIIPPVSGG